MSTGAHEETKGPYLVAPHDGLSTSTDGLIDRIAHLEPAAYTRPLFGSTLYNIVGVNLSSDKNGSG